MKLWTAVALILLFCISAAAGDQAHRDLTFEDRVRAQEAIERVRYKHQLGATKSFEAAVPRAVLENKVRDYLEKTAALQATWKTAVTDYALERELSRMKADTRMPDRLHELFAALGNDSSVIKECLARATLVDRLTRSFSENNSGVGGSIRDALVRVPVPECGTVASRAESPALAASCSIDGWDSGTLDDGPEASSPLSVWTGSEMLVWSGDEHGLGWRYDPAVDHWSPMSTVGAPATRFSATAIWTGGAFVVWGGQSAQPPYLTLDTGGRYDPATDTWTPTSTAGAPSARVLHTAVWTGSKMMVWGGSDGDHDLASGALYDPSTNTWTPTATAGAPSARASHSAVWTGSSVLVFGGYSDIERIVFNSGARYDPITNTWIPTSIVGAPALSLHSAVWTGSTMIVWSGFEGARYDLASNSWLPMSMANAPVGRQFHSAVWSGSAMIVWGGSSPSGQDFNAGARYDPVANLWTPTSLVGAPSARVGHATVWTGQLMIVWGGYSRTAAPGFTNILGTGGRYDPVADSWTPTATGAAGSPSPRSGHTAVWTGNQMVVWGGDATEPSGVNPLGTGGRYDPATDSWSSIATSNAPSPRVDHTAVWTGDAMIVWGGGYYDLGAQTKHEFNTGGRYDPIADNWTPTSTVGAPAVRQSHTAVWTGTEMVVWGGIGDAGNGNHPPLSTGGRYDPATNTWESTSASGAPSARDGHSAVWTGITMVVWGGGYLGSAGSTGAQYDPDADTWSPTAMTGAPAPRSGHTAVWTGSAMLIWGGEANAPPFDGASYDPASDAWQPMTRIGQPAALSGNSAIWTGSEMVTWGGVAADPSNAGGRYDPDTGSWRTIATSGAPSDRYGHSAVWTGSRMIVWGGARSIVKLATGGSYFMDGIGTDDCDGDGFTVAGGDCNDHDPGVHPGATETCNGVDDSCDGLIDEGGDALCDSGNPCMIDTCQPLGGCVHTPAPEYTDCDDGDACDGYNDQCDGYGYCAFNPLQCNDFYDCTLDTCDRHYGCQYEVVTSPPEVVGLYAVGDKATYIWSPLYIATQYDVVRGSLASLPMGPGSGDEVCFNNGSDTTLTDGDTPAAGTGYWYLIRGKNSCASPGTYGLHSNGTPRDTATCP